MFPMLEDLERQRLGMQVLSFCCFWHVSNVGSFGKATFWDVGFELLLLLACFDFWKIWKSNVLECRF